MMPTRSFASLRSIVSNRPHIHHPIHHHLTYLPLARPSHQFEHPHPTRRIHTSPPPLEPVRMSTLLSKHLGLSRRQSERMILLGRVTLFGKVVKLPSLEVPPSNHGRIMIKVDGRLIHDVGNTWNVLQSEPANGTVEPSHPPHGRVTNTTRVWLANKLKRELITEEDPDGRPSMIQRLLRGGVGGGNIPTHLKPVGRLDMMTEGLMIFTNDGRYAREMELPVNQLWRTYRVRVHGRLTVGKLGAMRRGVTVRLDEGGGKDSTEGGEVVKSVRTVRYGGIKVSIDRKSLSMSNRHGRSGGVRGNTGGTNTWLQITCTEGKNRMLRRILGSMGLDVTRLIRISYGDYDLNTIPPGRAVEVPPKRLETMKRKGGVHGRHDGKSGSEEKRKGAVDVHSSDEDCEEGRPPNPIKWIHYS